jgi:4-hydroxybenzoate polyprenyltransferase
MTSDTETSREHNLNPIAKAASIFADIKLAHTVFALPFALASAHIAFNGRYDWTKLILILACMFTARNAAMAFNRWLDRDIDTVNPRTRNRAIPSGKVNAGEMLIFVILNSLIFIVLTYFLNLLAFLLSPIALMIILGYSYFKRFTSWSHIILGLSLAIAPIGAWIAIRGQFDFLPILLSLAVIFWVAGFDIIYACRDMDFDSLAGLHSIPKKFGIVEALALSTTFHVVTIGLLVLFGYITGLGFLYYILTGIIALILLVEHMIITPSNLNLWGIAFFTLNGAVSILFYVAVILDTALR